MDPISAGASIAAFIQLADRVVSLCKFYIENIRDAPYDLRIILIEFTSLKCILENVDFLLKVDSDLISDPILALWSRDGTLDACRQCLTQLEALFPKDGIRTDTSRPRKTGNKRQKISQVATVLAWPFKEGRARKLLEEVSRHKATITLALSAESSRDIKEVKSRVKSLQVALEDSERRTFYEWLEKTDPSDLHAKACELHNKRTSMWMLESQEWKKWIAKKYRCLWIHGIPGAGKTVLASFLIESIKPSPKPSGTVGLVYCYCYFGHSQDETMPLLGWVIGQLCRQVQLVPDSLLSLYKTGRRPRTEQLLAGLAGILDLFRSVYVIVDALDESKEPRDQILGVLKSIATESRFEKIQLLVTSREYFDIESVMKNCSVGAPMLIDEVQADIWKYVNSTLHGDRRYSTWPEELRDEVQSTLAISAKGMFRWAVCQIDILRRLSTIDAIRRAVTTLPETLDETYERIFATIPVQERDIVQRALCLLCGFSSTGFAETISAPIFLSMVLGDWRHENEACNDRILNVDMLKEMCGCLVTISAADGSSRAHARLAHFTVNEFLFSERLMTNNIPSLRVFALDSKIVNYTMLYVTLSGVIGYEGPMAKYADSANDLYDFLLFYSFQALIRNGDMPWVWSFEELLHKFFVLDSTHLERLRFLGKYPGLEPAIEHFTKAVWRQ